jgi:hypothetical protein
MACPNAHQSETFKVFAPKRTTSHKEYALISSPGLEVLPHNCNLVVVPRAKQGPDVRGAFVGHEERIVMVDPLIDRAEFARRFDDLLSGGSTQEGTKAGKLRLK